MSKSPRKSIVASFGLLSAEIEGDQSQENPPAVAASAPAPATTGRVAAGVIGATHRAIDDIRTERDRLKALVEQGGAAIVEIDPAVIDPSPFPDRLADDDMADFDAFKRSFATEGQKVPIQVRKHPGAPGRFQIVYGHRRWLAARQLGLRLRAIEVELSDADLVVAQGIENANRQDLTWIERALFASRMDEAGIKSKNIYAALSIDDAELARMRSVYRSVPRDVIEAIGRAPKIGRPRWVELANAIGVSENALARLRETVFGEEDRKATSDQRFQHALTAIAPAPKPRDGAAGTPLLDAKGRMLAACQVSAKGVRVTASGSAGGAFLKYLQAELPRLAAEFAKERG